MTHTNTLSSPQPSKLNGEPKMGLNLEIRAEKVVRERAAQQSVEPAAIIEQAFRECNLTPPVVHNRRANIGLDFFEPALSEFDRKRGKNDPNMLIRDILGIPDEEPVHEPAQRELAFA